MSGEHMPEGGFRSFLPKRILHVTRTNAILRWTNSMEKVGEQADDLKSTVEAADLFNVCKNSHVPYLTKMREEGELHILNFNACVRLYSVYCHFQCRAGGARKPTSATVLTSATLLNFHSTFAAVAAADLLPTNRRHP